MKKTYFILIIAAFTFFLIGINSIDKGTTSEQKANLESTLYKSIVHCYCVEGTYPPNLDYLRENYGFTYDENLFYVDYVSIGANIMPDVTIISIY